VILTQVHAGGPFINIILRHKFAALSANSLAKSGDRLPQRILVNSAQEKSQTELLVKFKISSERGKKSLGGRNL